MSTNKENNLVIIIKDENLLRNSFVTQEHDLIINMIDRRPRVRFGELTTKQVRYFDNIYNKVLRIAIMEWVWIKSFDDYKENEKFHCQLCGQPIKYILKIFNRKTKKEMLIGSECVKHFGIGNNEEIDNQTEHNRKIRYLNQLDEEFPGIEKTIDFWNEFIDENDYIIANDYTESYIEIGSKIKKLYEKYLKQNTTQKSRLDIVQSLERLFKEGELERKVIQSIVDSYKEDLFAPRKEYLKRVDEETKMDILSRFEGGSKVNRLIGWRINNIMLTKHVISLISGDIKKNRFKPQRIIEFKGRTGVILNYEELNYIDFFCYHKDIVQIFCEEVFDDKDSFQLVDIDKFNDLIKTVKIIDYDMMASAVRMILDQRSNRYEIYENEFTDYGFNEVFIRDKVGNTFYQLDLNSFVENFSSILFKDNKSDANKISAFISDKGKIIKKEDIDYLTSRRA